MHLHKLVFQLAMNMNKESSKMKNIEDSDLDGAKEGEATARLLHFTAGEEIDCSWRIWLLIFSDSDSERDSDSDVISNKHAAWLKFIPD